MYHGHFRVCLVAALGLATGVARPLPCQEKPATKVGLAAEALAGQSVATLPLTMILRDTTLKDSTLLRERSLVLQWADSLIGEGLVEGAPAVNWVLPAELRRVARRSAGFVPDPDRMGQAVMRSTRIKTVPDPLRSSLRSLMALAGGRHAFIPAALSFMRDEEGAIRATLAAVLVDARLGSVLWRTTAIGTGATPGDALKAAVTSFLPTEPQ